MDLKDFAKRADEIIGLADAVLPTMSVGVYGCEYDPEKYGAFRAAGMSFLANTFGEQHAYYREFSEQTKEVWPASAKAGRGIISAAKGEVAGGWAVTARGIVSAVIFTDFLDMAKHLLDEGYKDAAAVVTGSTLEEHLRQLAMKCGVALEILSKGAMVPKKADVLNADLMKAQAYGLLQQKSVTAWLDLRNKAAHGKYAEYKKDEVVLMWQGIVQFIASYPA